MKDGEVPNMDTVAATKSNRCRCKYRGMNTIMILFTFSTHKNNHIKRFIRTKYCLYRHLNHFKRFHIPRMTRIP